MIKKRESAALVLLHLRRRSVHDVATEITSVNRGVEHWCPRAYEKRQQYEAELSEMVNELCSCDEVDANENRDALCDEYDDFFKGGYFASIQPVQQLLNFL